MCLSEHGLHIGVCQYSPPRLHCSLIIYMACVNSLLIYDTRTNLGRECRPGRGAFASPPSLPLTLCPTRFYCTCSVTTVVASTGVAVVRCFAALHAVLVLVSAAGSRLSPRPRLTLTRYRRSEYRDRVWNSTGVRVLTFDVLHSSSHSVRLAPRSDIGGWRPGRSSYLPPINAHRNGYQL